MPSISIIIPVYNTEQYLHRCVDSVLSQTFEDFELLLVDDGSTDKSGAICDEYAAKDSRVRVFHKENGGVGSARDLGLDNAIGDYVTFADSDDWIEKTMFEEMYGKLSADQADLVYCDINTITDYSREVYSEPEFSQDKFQMLNSFILSKVISLWRIMVSRTIFEKNNIRHPEKISFAEDYHVVIRLLFFADKICYVDKALCNYYRGNTSSITHHFSEKHSEQGRWVFLDIIRFTKEEGVYDRLAKALCWKLLVFIQDDVLNKQTFDRFVSIHPEKSKYILSCPSLNLKIKVIMWSLTHHLRFVAELIVYLRNILKR